MKSLLDDLIEFYKLHWEKMFTTSHDEFIELSIDDMLAIYSIGVDDWKSLTIQIMFLISED